MDLYKENPEVLSYKAKAEKYAKIIAKTIILSGMDAASFGQNAYFYDSAEGLLTATILLVAEFCEPSKRHIVSVFKIIQELLAPSNQKGKNQFQQLMEMLPEDHKAKWYAGSALNGGEQSMASVMSTALSRLNAFLDSELEQLLCFDTEVDAEKCTACGACVKACPRMIIELRNKGRNGRRMVVLCVNKDKGPVTRKACEVGCIGCSKCQKVCPFEAITIANNLAYIDYEKCKLCRKCEDECPQHSIVAVNFPARKPKPAPAEEAPKAEK